VLTRRGSDFFIYVSLKGLPRSGPQDWLGVVCGRCPAYAVFGLWGGLVLSNGLRTLMEASAVRISNLARWMLPGDVDPTREIRGWGADIWTQVVKWGCWSIALRPHSGNIEGTLRPHVGNMEAPFREHWGNVEAPIREHWGNMDATCREHWGPIQGTLMPHSGNIEALFREYWGPIQGTLRPHSENIEVTFKLTSEAC
jgi:hypothetical protein